MCVCISVCVCLVERVLKKIDSIILLSAHSPPTHTPIGTLSTCCLNIPLTSVTVGRRRHSLILICYAKGELPQKLKKKHSVQRKNKKIPFTVEFFIALRCIKYSLSNFDRSVYLADICYGGLICKISSETIALL